MKEIRLKEIILKNFKGIVDLTVPFEDVTNIYGPNGSGKTTIFDAFTWLLFDKDSSNREKFEIKTLDKGQVQHGLDHIVIGTITINGKPKIFQKTFHEKWEKERGTAEKRYTGNETLYFINEVPVKMTDYNKAVNELLNETSFKMLTNPLYFAKEIDWQDRRSVLLNIIGDIPINEVIDSDKELEPLRELLVDSDTETLKKSLNAKKKKLNEEVEKIPIRIDECNNSIREINADAIKSDVDSKQKKLDDIDLQLLSHTKPDPGILEKKNKFNSIQLKISKLEREGENKKFEKEREFNKTLTKHENELREHKRIIEDNKSRIKTNTASKEEYEKKAEQLRNDWHSEHNKPFEITDDFTCPTCHRKLDEDSIEKKKQEMKENFNNEKAKKLASITEEGTTAANKVKEIKTSITEFEAKITVSEQAIELCQENINSVKKQLEEHKASETEYGPEHESLQTELKKLEKELEQPADAQQKIEDLTKEKKVLQKEIDKLKIELNQETNNKKMKDRIVELEKQERDFSQQIAEVEQQIFLCEKFEKTKAELLESSINNKFSFVRFKMFDTQINGGLKPNCEVLVDGVPFRDANNAGRINAGIDIINALSEHFDTTAPIFLDNRESINEIIPTSAQLINLIVTRDKQLKVG